MSSSEFYSFEPCKELYLLDIKTQPGENELPGY